MKRYYDAEDDSTLIIGTAREIKSLYASMMRHGFCPSHCDEPKFNMEKLYGLSYRGMGDTFENSVMVHNEHTCLALLIGQWEE